MSKDSLVQSYRSKRVHHVIGLMSGTSLDGVDGVLLEIKSDQKLRVRELLVMGRASIGYSPEARAKLNELCVPGKADIRDVNIAHSALAHWNAEVVNSLVKSSKVPVDVVGMHGQTVWHEPNGLLFPLPQGPAPVTATLQLGNPQVLSALTGLPVVSDFRSADMAVGGQGAPLAPFIDQMLFSQPGMTVCVQNIGGIGNVTVLPKDGEADSVYAFDTGPGNMLIDSVVRWGSYGKEQYDKGGQLAAQGQADSEMLDLLMSDPYFAKKPPKSTGREAYGDAFASSFIQLGQKRGLSYEDMVATATAFTARSIAEAYRDFILHGTSPGRVVVCGGGARNTTLMGMLQAALKTELVSSTQLGVLDIDREAMAFALLAHCSMMGLASNIPGVTGAQKPVILGTITMQQL